MEKPAVFDNRWEEIKYKLKYQWEKLTEDDFMSIENNKLAIADTLQARYGYTRMQAEKAVRNFFQYRYYNVQTD